MKLFPVTFDDVDQYRQYKDEKKDKYPLAFDCWLARKHIINHIEVPLHARLELHRIEGHVGKFKHMVFYYEGDEYQ